MAAAEEIAFRGALLGLLLRRHRRATAVASSSLLFGLWHLLPTLPAMRRYPIVTCWQVTADMAFSTRVPSGHGHAYGSEEAVARAKIAPPPRLDPGSTARLQQLIGDRRVSAARPGGGGRIEWSGAGEGELAEDVGCGGLLAD